MLVNVKGVKVLATGTLAVEGAVLCPVVGQVRSIVNTSGHTIYIGASSSEGHYPFYAGSEMFINSPIYLHDAGVGSIAFADVEVS